MIGFNFFERKVIISIVKNDVRVKAAKFEKID